MPHARGGAWARKTARERWSIRRCGSIRPSRGPSICGPGAPRRADFHRLASINMETANEELSSASACRNPNGREDSSAFPTSPQGGDGLPRPTRGRIWHGDSGGRRAARAGGGRPLAIGRAIMDGPTMAREEKGKAIQTIHHVGDEIWRLGEEEP